MATLESEAVRTMSHCGTKLKHVPVAAPESEATRTMSHCGTEHTMQQIKTNIYNTVVINLYIIVKTSILVALIYIITFIHTALRY